MTPRNLTALLLGLSALNLTLMIPGGFVETRVFPDYPIWVVAGFNVFLTVLGLGSFLLAWRIWRGAHCSLWALAAGMAYVAVYVLDLAVIFPVSVSPMSVLLESLEWTGVVLGLGLILAGAWFWRHAGPVAGREQRMGRYKVIGLVALSGAIVVFATVSAFSN